MSASRMQVAIWAAAAVLGVLAVVRIVGGQGGGQGDAVPVKLDGRGASAPASPAGVPRRAAAGGPYVHVAGRVRRPGLYRLPAGERVAGALERAGGPARGADLAAVNLAAPVQDGQQIVVPRRGATQSAGPAGAAAAPGAAGRAKLSLASASVDQLDGLDGIGPTLAKRIVEYREAHGGFRSLSELNAVEGIGEKRLRSLREAVGP
jgi:competence protein ComEA